jgi:hypothetical protein
MAFESWADAASKTEQGKVVSFCQVPLPPEATKKFRELSESFWELQEFASPQFAEAEVIPLLTPTGELDDEGAYKVLMTEAVDAPFEKLLDALETVFQVKSIFGSILRCVLVRVKSGKKIYPHIDNTFLGTDHEIYRMQIVSASEKPFYQFTGSGGEINEGSPHNNELMRIPRGAIQQESNPGLNDNIHALVYFQRQTASEELAKMVADRDRKIETAAHKKVY